MIVHRENLTPAEREQMEHEKAMFDKQAAHSQQIKALEIESYRIEAGWAAVMRIPLTIIKLPVLLAIGVAICIFAGKGQEPPEKLVALIKG